MQMACGLSRKGCAFNPALKARVRGQAAERLAEAPAESAEEAWFAEGRFPPYADPALGPPAVQREEWPSSPLAVPCPALGWQDYIY